MSMSSGRVSACNVLTVLAEVQLRKGMSLRWAFERQSKGSSDNAHGGDKGEVSRSHLALFLSYKCGNARADPPSMATTPSPTQCVAN